MNASYDQLLNNVSFRLYSILRSNDYSQLRQILYNDQLHDPSSFSDRDAQELLGIFLQNMNAPLTESHVRGYVGRLARLDEQSLPAQIHPQQNPNNKTLSSQSLAQQPQPSLFPSLQTANVKSAPMQTSNLVRRGSHLDVQPGRANQNPVSSANFQSQSGSENQGNLHDVTPQFDSSEKFRRIFNNYDLRGTGQILAGDVYFAVIEVVQKHPSSSPVPTFAKVNNMLAALYPSAQALSYEEFVRLLSVLRESGN